MAKQKDLSTARPATLQVRAGQQRSQFDETSEAMYLTSGFVYDTCQDAEDAFAGNLNRYMYGRYSNPTNTMFEDRMKAIEGADFCAGVASGMAAVSASLVSSLSPGDRLVSSNALFGNCFWVVDVLLRRLGVEVVLIDGTDLNVWEQALSVPTQAVFFETPSNPTMQLIDIRTVCDMAKISGARVFADNVFATPVGQKCLDLGADVVIYSTTKHIDGQGRTLAGAVLTNDSDWFNEVFFPYVRNTGPSLSPFNAWNMIKGLETLTLRVEKQCDTALKLAAFLENLDGIDGVLYPGLKSHPHHDLAHRQMLNYGSLMGIYITGDKAHTYKVLDGLNIIDISNNLGDAKTLIAHPASTTHSKLTEDQRQVVGITGNFVRLSVGLEDVQDLQDDFIQVLKKIDTIKQILYTYDEG